MPKLSQDTLAKRFTCHYCGESLRTRQGLFGHIQFKHTLIKDTTDPYVDKMMQLQKQAKIWNATVKETNMSKEIGELGINILYRWYYLLCYFHRLNIDLSDKEFKNFFFQHFRVTGSKSEQETQLALKALELLNSQS